MSQSKSSMPHPMGSHRTLQLLKSKLFATHYVGVKHLFDTAHGSTLISKCNKLNKEVTVCVRDKVEGIRGETPGMWGFVHEHLTDLVDIVVDDEANLYLNISTDPEGVDLDMFARQYTKYDDDLARKNVHIVMKMLCNLFKSMMDANIGLLPLKDKAFIVKSTYDGEICELKIRRNFLCKTCKLSDFKENLRLVATMFTDLYDNLQKGDLLCQPELPFFQGLLPTSEMTLEELMELPYLQYDPVSWTKEDRELGPKAETAEEEYNSEEDSDYEDEDAEDWSECDCEEDGSCHCDSEDEDDEEEEEEEGKCIDDDAVSVHTAVESSEDFVIDEPTNRRLDEMMREKYLSFANKPEETFKIPTAAELQQIQDELDGLKLIVEEEINFALAKEAKDDEVRSEYAFELLNERIEDVDDEVRSVYAYEPLNERIVEPIDDAAEDDDEVRSEYAFEYQEKAQDDDVKSVYAFDALNIKDDEDYEYAHSEYAFDLDLYEDVHSVYAFDINEDVEVPSKMEAEEDDEVRSEYAFEYQETKKVEIKKIDPPTLHPSYYYNDVNHNVYESSWCQQELTPYCPTGWF